MIIYRKDAKDAKKDMCFIEKTFALFASLR